MTDPDPTPSTRQGLRCPDCRIPLGASRPKRCPGCKAPLDPELRKARAEAAARRGLGLRGLSPKVVLFDELAAKE